MKRCVPLEPAAEAVSNQNSIPPLIFQLPPKEGRKLLEEAQNSPVYKYPSDIFVREINTGEWGCISLYFVLPQCDGASPQDSLQSIEHVIFYIHGAGWVFGSFHTHEKLVRELAARTNSLVIFPEYALSPEAKYPVAMEQCYFVLSHLWEILEESGYHINRPIPLVVAGDSVGGNLAIVMVLLSEKRYGPEIQKLLLYYPVTNACFDTPSYCKFATNYYLYRAGMQWFWNQYTTCSSDRNQITVSPLRANIDCLKDFPSTMIINGEADVLRDEGKAFAAKLLCAGVDVTAVQIQGIIHDFVMLNALDQTNACRTAMNISTSWINSAQ